MGPVTDKRTDWHQARESDEEPTKLEGYDVVAEAEPLAAGGSTRPRNNAGRENDTDTAAQQRHLDFHENEVVGRW